MPQSEVVTVYAGEQPPPRWSAAVFLAGPTPREAGVRSWRPDAIRALRGQWACDGRLVVFVPEPPGGQWAGDYTAQVEWEKQMLHLADEIIFWVPRDLNDLPGFTTNVEFGAWHNSGKVVFGAPPRAPKTRYLLYYARQNHVPTGQTLHDTVTAALVRIADGAPRRDGEREVPLLVWRTASFQRWHTTQRAAGNTLTSARLQWTYRVGPTRAAVFYWALQVRIHVAAENREKSEVVISRHDLATVALYHPADNLDDTTVVLVREFRAAATTTDGFIRELPGGAADLHDPRHHAVAELAEETGLVIEPGRLRSHGSRQLAGTSLAHRAHLYSACITADELGRLRQHTDTPHGNAADTEMTWLEFHTFGRLRVSPDVDWATLGMISQALLSLGPRTRREVPQGQGDRGPEREPPDTP